MIAEEGEERKTEGKENILFLELIVLQKALGNSVTKIIDSMERKGLMTIFSTRHPISNMLTEWTAFTRV